MNTARGRKSWRAGYTALLACMLIQAVPFAVAVNIQPQFLSYVVEGEGFSLAGFSLIFTIGTLASAGASPLIGVLFKRLGVRFMFTLGCALAGGGFLCFAFASSLWQFYLLAAVTQVGTATISSIGVPVIISAWYDERIKGKAMGMAFAGGSLGNAFLQSIATAVIPSYGYSRAYLVFGLASLLVGLPTALLLIKLPSEPSQVIDPAPRPRSRPKGGAQSQPARDSSLKQLLKAPSFYLFAFGFSLMGIYISAMGVQYPTYLRTQLGMDAAAVGLVGSVFAISALVGNLAGGWLFDRIGHMPSLIIAFFLSITACVSLIFSDAYPPLAYLFAVCLGLSAFSYVIGPAYLTGRLFGQREYSAILGVVNLIFSLGFAAGSSVMGLVIQTFGYRISWIAMLFVSAGAYLLLVLMPLAIAKRR